MNTTTASSASIPAAETLSTTIIQTIGSIVAALGVIIIAYIQKLARTEAHHHRAHSK